MLALHEGNTIHDADGAAVGRIHRLVIDPSGRRVTHVVIQKGHLLTTDVVAPVEVLTQDPSGGVQLRPGVATDELPAFEEAHYVALDEKALEGMERPRGTAIAWAFPASPIGGMPVYPSMDTEYERNVPSGSTIVDTGTTVRSLDGEELGSIAEVGVTDDGRLNHVTVDPGWFKDPTVIPAHWMIEQHDDEVRLAFTSRSLEMIT